MIRLQLPVYLPLGPSVEALLSGVQWLSLQFPVQGQNGYGLPGNTALENELAYNNALANGVNSNALGGLPLFGQGAALIPAFDIVMHE